MAENIEIRIHYVGESFPANAVVATIQHIESIIYEQERRELETLARDLEEMPSLAVDAARHRLGTHSGESILFYSASQGSILLIGAVAGLAGWILDKTLGETLKEAWVESDLHKRIKRLLGARVNYKGENIAAEIERRRAISLGEHQQIELSPHLETSGASTTINIHVTIIAINVPRLDRIVQPAYASGSIPSKPRENDGIISGSVPKH